MVHGNVRWALDFSHYILDGLFELADELQPYFNDKETFAQKGTVFIGRYEMDRILIQCSEIDIVATAASCPLQHVPCFPANNLPRIARRAQPPHNVASLR